MISLRSISPEEFARWKTQAILTYAAEKEKSGLSAEDAKFISEKSFRELLPNDQLTREHYLYSVIEETSQRTVGTLWWGLQRQGKDPLPWIYDIILDESVRGKGYGRATMQAAERDVKAKGFARLGLHVFGHNGPARKLYESMAFEVKSLVMQKNL